MLGAEAQPPLLQTQEYRCADRRRRKSRSKKLRKTLGPWSLTAFGIGAVIGSGIFILTGTAAAGETLQLHVHPARARAGSACCTAPRRSPRWAGPAPARRISLSFLLTAIACGFAGAVLRGAGVDDPDRGQRLHVCLRHARRDFRLDHRLGSDPRVRRFQHGGGGRVFRLPERSSRQRFRLCICREALPSPPSLRRTASPAPWFNVAGVAGADGPHL